MHEARNAIARRRFCDRPRTLFIGGKKFIAAERADHPGDVNDGIRTPGEVIKGGSVLQITFNLPHLVIEARPRRLAHQG